MPLSGAKGKRLAVRLAMNSARGPKTKAAVRSSISSQARGLLKKAKTKSRQQRITKAHLSSLKRAQSMGVA